jgi:hypothetical protein
MDEYPRSEGERKKEIAGEIRSLRREMENLTSARKRERKTQSLYGDSTFLVPCLFNSGCATGKHGITTLEIEGGNISLVYWTLDPGNKPFMKADAQQLEYGGETLHRYIIQKESLDAVFARIKLLGGPLPKEN